MRAASLALHSGEGENQEEGKADNVESSFVSQFLALRFSLVRTSSFQCSCGYGVHSGQLSSLTRQSVFRKGPINSSSGGGGLSGACVVC